MSQTAVQSLASLYAQIRRAAPAERVEVALMSGFPAPSGERVTWHNWMRPPFNRWGFRNLPRLRPMIDVARGSGPVSSLPEAPQSLEALAFESTCGEEVSVFEHLLASRTDAFLVLHRGAVVFERYFNGQCPEDRHIMFSVTKSLIGLLGEQLVSQGALDTQVPAIGYVPELEGSAFGDATVRQLFDMAVGIHYSEIYDDPNSESSQYGYACGFQPTPADYAQYESLYQYLPSLKKKGEHGGLFHYVTATTEALAWVMERASGRACSSLLQDVWQALGCERDGCFMADPWGRGVAGAGFNATLRDMGRFGQLVLDGGQHQGRQLIAADAIERIAAGADPAIYAADTDFSHWTPGASYRSQWYVFNDHSQALMAGGIHGQYLFIDRPSGVVIVKQSSLPEAVTELDADSVRMMRAIAAHLGR
ncbi:serine hydrolase domain-containing protein [Pseudomonas citronellolis]|uniref:serine hydrolase domain-containing protein n=1 Tax=Pseudomonas citronellolis TaxID=53408 RepID=UPI0018D98B4B|nr:serine hydrolase [Pseudomonas citronellolis]MBH3433881.1 serine hydrolase [Pseudomonas citronellolis]